MSPRALAALLLALAGPIAGGQERAIDLLFIHHSVGLRWLGLGGLWDALHDPRLMGGRRLRAHLATYGDDIGWDTDVRHWPEKFGSRMDAVLSFDHHKNVYYREPGRANSIVLFKSCFTCAALKADGDPPGDGAAPERSLWNYKAAMRALSGTFAAYPHVLFVFITSPPLSPCDPGRERNVYPQESNTYRRAEAARYRAFCRWLEDEWVPGHRRATGLANVAVFDLFGVLAEGPEHPEHPGALKAAFRNSKDSQPLPIAHWTATGAFVPWFVAALDAWEATPWGAAARSGRGFPWLSPGRAPAAGAPRLLLDHPGEAGELFLLAAGRTPGACAAARPLGPLPPGTHPLALSIPALPDLLGAGLVLQVLPCTPGSVPGNPLKIHLSPTVPPDAPLPPVPARQE